MARVFEIQTRLDSDMRNQLLSDGGWYRVCYRSNHGVCVEVDRRQSLGRALDRIGELLAGEELAWMQGEQSMVWLEGPPIDMRRILRLGLHERREGVWEVRR